MKSLHVMRAYAIGKLCIGREEKKKKKREAQLLLRLADRTHRTNYAPKFPPESPLTV